jgi:hypothetical protein
MIQGETQVWNAQPWAKRSGVFWYKRIQANITVISREREGGGTPKEGWMEDTLYIAVATCAGSEIGNKTATEKGEN